MSANGCPEEARLIGLALGTLPEAELPPLARHLDGCPECEGRLRRLDALPDPLLRELRQLPAVDDAPEQLTARVQLTARPRPEAAPGKRRLGRFELLDELGAGTFAQVYRAWDPELERLVALKVPRPGALADAADTERFLREARSVARLHHPGIVALHEIGQTEDGACFLVEEYIPGVTLAQRLQQGCLEAREAAAVLLQVARALQYAHEHGVIHRDLKPANVLLSGEPGRVSAGEPGRVSAGRSDAASGRAPPPGAHAAGLARADAAGLAACAPKIADFGLAKRDAEEAPLTLEGQVLGTPAYMSPEQARGDSHAVDARSDVYSLGVVLYEMLTGERPFHGTRRMLLLQVLEDEPRPPRQLNDKVPRDLEVICLKCLSKSPPRRYATAAELADDLERHLAGEPIRARPAGWPRRLARWGRRHPLTASLFLAVTLGSAFGLAHLSHLSRELVRSAALESAAQHSEILEVVNVRFNSQVIQRLPRGVAALPDYLKHPGAVPLPATFTIDLGEQLAKLEGSGVQVRLFSDYPWPWRKDGGPRDDFERDALAQLRKTPDQAFYRFEPLGGKQVLRYAIARRMEQECLACHNHMRESPKKDWRVGDVRGVVEIIRPLDRDVERTNRGLRGTFLLMAAVSGILLGAGVLAMVLGQRRRHA